MSCKNRLLVMASLLAFAATAAWAQKKAADIPVEKFFQRAQFHDMKLSPDGERLAALAPRNGRDNLVVIDLKTRTRKIITGYETYDVQTYTWISNDRLCFRAGDGRNVTGEPNYRGSGCTDHDGANFRDFSRLANNTALGGYLALADDGSPNVYVQLGMRNRESLDVYKFNTMTGRGELLSLSTPGDVQQWVLDRNFVPRVAVSQPERKNNEVGRPSFVWYRDNADAKWEKIAEFDSVLTGESFQPLAFDFDNTTLYVSTNQGRDKAAIYKYDTKARKLGEIVLENPIVDVAGGLVFSKTRKKLIGVRWDADKPGVRWLDADLEKLQKLLDNTFPKTFNTITPAWTSDKNALVWTVSDQDPGMFHLLDRTKPTIEPLLHSRDWLDPDLMAERRFITYQARDGMVIPAWLTIPKGTSGKNLPLIVNIHGGPWVRGYHMVQWGRWPEAQFFASRGYAVLEPEPRGSTGYGKKHYVSSFKQWGQTMQDDITDGALYLVKEGIVDKSRMCLHGGSYGGYATAMGLAKNPELWRCGTPFVAVTDMFLKASIAYSDTAVLTDWYESDARRVIGDPEKDKDIFTAYSPTLQASKIRAPILIAMGSNDVRVPVAHGVALKDAVERAGGQIELVVYDGEGHGFNKDENVVDFYTRLEKFFARFLK